MNKIYCLFLIIFSSSAFGEIVSDFTNRCGTSGSRILYAVPKSFTCASGQFLPANAIQCYDCPSGYTCNGGTYQFSSKNAQGIVKNENYTQFTTNEHYTCASNFNHVMNGSWTPNVITLNWDYKDGRTSTSQCVYDTLITDIPANPTRPGYKFMGWRVKTDN